MKIDLQSSAVNLLHSDWSGRQVSQSGGTSAPSANEDRVTLASTQANVEALTAQAMNSPQVRQDKVDALRQAVSNGSYKVDPHKIAGAILAEGE